MTEPETPQPVPENETLTATATEEAAGPGGRGRAAARAVDCGARERVECLLRLLRQAGGAALGLHGLVQLRDRLARLAALEDRAIDRRARSAGDDRRFLVHQKGRPWVDIPWLFQWAHAAIYKLVQGLVPVNPDRPDGQSSQCRANRGRRRSWFERAGAARDGVALAEDSPPRAGPLVVGACVTLALGVIYHPAYGLMMGGIAGPASFRPQRGACCSLPSRCTSCSGPFRQGRGGALALDPDFCSGPMSTIVPLRARRAGRGGRRPLCSTAPNAAAWPLLRESRQRRAGSAERAPIEPPSRRRNAALALRVCAVACLVNPFTYHAYESAIYPYLQLLQPASNITTVDLLSFFGPGFANTVGQNGTCCRHITSFWSPSGWARSCSTSAGFPGAASCRSR